MIDHLNNKIDSADLVLMLLIIKYVIDIELMMIFLSFNLYHFLTIHHHDYKMVEIEELKHILSLLRQLILFIFLQLILIEVHEDLMVVDGDPILEKYQNNVIFIHLHHISTFGKLP